MVDPQAVIHMENISVRYRAPEEPYRSFKEFAIQILRRQVKMRDFWALKDVNLDVFRGEMVGVIGRNGAGKSTLLKVVSRVLSPTKGRFIIEGKVAPLLEFGAGFQPEMTGRENIALNGSLLGHSQREINDHLPDILNFAQLDGFIDAPIRKYSSGMVARLGFAIATSWKPEILLLDEILAVGDEAFKTKCLSRIDGFRADGSTILLVTHNLNTVLTECDRAVWIEHGSIMIVGEVKLVVDHYLENIKNSSTEDSNEYGF
jgi:ABC-type polysaccharide/polyol phosphate transport system ATPase subunit